MASGPAFLERLYVLDTLDDPLRCVLIHENYKRTIDNTLPSTFFDVWHDLAEITGPGGFPQPDDGDLELPRKGNAGLLASRLEDLAISWLDQWTRWWRSEDARKG